MKRYLLVNLLLTLILTACAAEARPTEQGPLHDSYPNDSYPNGDSPSSDTPANWIPAHASAISALSATLNLPPEQITLISTEAVEWRDGCLGIQKMGVMCTQAIVPGYKIILEANSKQYEFHTNKDGSQVIQVESAAVTGSVEEMMIKQLAFNLELKESDISVVGISEVEFADACLGVAMQNVMCAQVVTPGKIVVLEVDGVQYEYHISYDGARVQPATLALIWTREGGIAGFCDSLTVFLSGEVYGNQCRPQPNGTAGTFANLLSATERRQFDAWINKFGQVNLDASNPEGVADRMVLELVLYGNGAGKPNKAEETAMFTWAQDLYQKLYS